MPLFTFCCDGCGHEEEILCKVSEREAQTAQCPDGSCPKFGDVLKWRGVEGSQATRLSGKYQFQLKDSRGKTVLRKPPDGGF